MIPGINPREVQKLMKKMGIKEEQIDAIEVIIKTNDKNLVIKNPKVSKVNMMGQDSIQIIGEIEEESAISKEDVKMVAERAKVSEKDALRTLTETKGDIAEAILKLKR